MRIPEAWQARWRRAWPHLRVLFVLYHVLAIVVFALPSPRRMGDRSNWKSDRNQAELASWARTLSATGLDVSKDELEEVMWGLTQRYLAVRKDLIDPFDEYARYIGMAQGWRMFTNPQRRPGKLHVDVEIDGVWTPVFVYRSGEHDWMRWQFEHNRFRKQLGRINSKRAVRAYDQLTKWIARQAARDFPEATRLRTRLYRYRSLPPDRVRAGEEPEGEFTLPRFHPLEALR